MIAMVQADLLKLQRRRGLWLTSLLLPFVVGLILAILAITEAVDIDGGAAYVSDASLAMTIFGSVLAILVGARQGSDEHAAGTIRYQLLTGAPRWQLYLSKVCVLVIASGAIAASAAVPTILGALFVEAPPGEELAPGDMVSAWWNVLLPCLAYGGIAFGVGALLRTTGPAIAVALVLNLIGLDIVFALTLIDDWFRHLVLDIGVDRLTANELDEEDSVSVGAAIVIVIVWPALFIALGWLRLRRLEA